MYEYVYYKIYKLMDASMPGFIPDWRTGALMGMLEVLFIFPFIIYYQVFIDRYFHLTDSFIIWGILGIIILGILMYFTFWSKDQYKEIITRYDAWPKYKNRWGTLIVCLFIIAIIINFIFAFHLMSKIDWSLYR